MKEDLKNLIALAVANNTTFEGQIGTAYTVQELIHTVGVRAINDMGKKVSHKLKSLETDSFFETSNTVRANELKTQLDTLRAIFDYKQEVTKAEREKERLRKEAKSKLAILSKIKTEKELEELGKMDIKDIDKEIAKYSN